MALPLEGGGRQTGLLVHSAPPSLTPRPERGESGPARPGQTTQRQGEDAPQQPGAKRCGSRNSYSLNCTRVLTAAPATGRLLRRISSTIGPQETFAILTPDRLQPSGGPGPPRPQGRASGPRVAGGHAPSDYVVTGPVRARRAEKEAGELEGCSQSCSSLPTRHRPGDRHNNTDRNPTATGYLGLVFHTVYPDDGVR